MRRFESVLSIAMAVTLSLALSCGGSGKKKPFIGADAPDIAGADEGLRGEGGGSEWGDQLQESRVSELGEAGASCQSEPFAFGCPCSTNTQCQGGFCVDSDFGFLCTQECVEECPDPAYECKGMKGFGPDVVFLCIPKSVPLCKACETDVQCDDGVCTTIGDAKYCTSRCGNAKPCPNYYVCNEDGPEPLCMPASGSCGCTPETEGELRYCEQSNEFGVCEGVETCDPKVGFADCTAGEPAQEVCDGVDNDCDGKLDDNLGEPPTCGSGACTEVGVCAGALGWQCEAPLAEPEVCDFQDNDCDGDPDEDFKTEGKYVGLNHCGTCNHDCVGTIPNAVESCSAEGPLPQCVVGECDEGYFKWNDYQCLPEGQLLCKPCTADLECAGGSCLQVLGGGYCSQSCDVEACPESFACSSVEGEQGKWCLPASGACDCFAELAGTSKPCFATGELGTCVGKQICDPLVGWSACSATAPSAEVCDGLDNDCNGIPDDGLGGGSECEKSTPGIGTCKGTQYCAGAPGWVCDAPKPSSETCDYVDNDCDGSIDEDYLEDGKFTSIHHCGGCNKECEGAFPNATAFCDPTLAVPECRVQACNDGYFKLNDYLCIPAQAVGCKPCVNDSDCFALKCVPLEEGMYCLEPCQEGQCADGHQCTELGTFGSICVPDTGSCVCSEKSAGTKKGCSVTNDIGTCFGFETCESGTGWSDCNAPTPAVEVCDGQDNDCDGLADDGFGAAEPCQNDNEWGTCTGSSTCQGAKGWVCDALVPAQDLCNGQDDNCDGAKDEGFQTDGKYVGTENCGACGNDCSAAIPNATVACDGTFLVPKCVVVLCDPGYYQAGPGECLPKPDTTCEPCKNDSQCLGGMCVTFDDKLRCAIPCSTDLDCAPEKVCLDYPGKGLICQPQSGSCECSSASAGSKRACSASNGLGTCAGIQTCDPVAGWSVCTAQPPSEEICNGLDDDCDGSVDEGFEMSAPCEQSNEWGVCTGWSTCQGKLGLVCSADVPAEDTCNYLDDNCDGVADEGFVIDGKYALTQACGNCKTDCTGTIANATAKCDATYPVPKCVVDQCDAGFYEANPFLCEPKPDTTCEPCVTDTDCLGGLCVIIDGKARCSVECSTGDDCSGENECLEYPGGGLICQPVTGSCECSSATSGSKRYCTVTNDIGTCSGFQTCNAVAGWSDCTALVPAAETCNGVDDDCNGQIDNGLPATQPCEKANEFGTCSGSASCAGALGWLCQAPNAELETCDAKDNDCDGQVDEDYTKDGKYTLFDHCGKCNVSCASGFPNATAKCDETAPVPECVVASCAPGYFKINKYQCVNNVGSICSPCAVNTDCVGGGAECTQLNDGKYCMKLCTEDADCSPSFKCNTVGQSKLCIPATNSCTCTPVTVATVLPVETCVGDQTITVTGTGFNEGTLVYLGETSADSVTVVSSTKVEAFYKDLKPGTYALTVSNGGICVQTVTDAVTIIPKPSLYFIDPPVTYNGISIQVTAFVTDIQGGGVTFFGVRPTGTQEPFAALEYTFSIDSPRRVRAVVPAGLTPGLYDIQLEVAEGCGAILEKALTVTDTVSVNLTAVDPSFGWKGATTDVSLYAQPIPAQNKSGFKSLPRAYLTPAEPGPGDLAAGLEAIGYVDETRVTAVVPKAFKIGFYDLVVVNPDGGVGLLDNAFRVTDAEPPVITSVSPGSVPSNVVPDVTILGKNFYGPALSLKCKPPAGAPVSLLGVIKSWKSNSISATLPTKGLAAGTVCLVRVTNADGAYWDYSAVGLTNPSENLEPMVFVSSMLTPRRAPAVTTVRATASAQFLYAIGGDDGTAAGALASIEAVPLDPYGVLGTWRAIPGGLPQPRTLAAAVRLGQFLYVAGGNNGQSPLASVLRAKVLSPDDSPVLDDLTVDLGETGLNPGVWFYRVSAVLSANDLDNPGGESLPSDPLPVLVPAGLPAPLVPTIYWKPVSGAVAYRVYRSPSPGLAAGSELLVAIAEAAATNWTDTGATAQAGAAPHTIGDLGTWHQLPPLNKAREGAGMAYVNDPVDANTGYLYVVGGRGDDAIPLKTYEYLPISTATGRPVTGAAWTEVVANPLGVGRWQHALYVVDGSVTSHVAANEVWLMAGSGMGAGLVPVSNVDGAKVQAGGLLSAWTPSDSLAPAFVGCGFAAAANQLWAFGGQNAKPSVSGKSAQLCGIGTSCGALPALGGWNAGIQLKQDRYLMGSTVGAAHILIVGGVGTGNVPLASVETTVW